MNIYTAVRYCCILHGRVCVMTHRILPESWLSDIEMCMMTDTQAIDLMTFYFKGTGAGCVVFGSTDNRINKLFFMQNMCMECVYAFG